MITVRDGFLLARNFIVTDVSRELELAKTSSADAGTASLQALGVTPGGGNFLAALAMLCYTEFAGSIVTGKSGIWV